MKRQDSVIGLTPGQQENLFEAFKQADEATTQHFGGTGLGLNISLQSVHRMGGNIGVESQPGEGSLFWFTARFGKVSDQAALQADSGIDRVRALIADQPGRLFKGFRVLLADGSTINQIVCREMLQMLGIEVVVVDNGQQAFEAVTRVKFDVLLLDCHMPVLDGFGATRLIRAREVKLNLPRVPILAVTARAMEGDRKACLEAGMYDYLSKPLQFDMLVERLSGWLPEGAAGKDRIS